MRKKAEININNIQEALEIIADGKIGNELAITTLSRIENILSHGLSRLAIHQIVGLTERLVKVAEFHPDADVCVFALMMGHPMMEKIPLSATARDGITERLDALGRNSRDPKVRGAAIAVAQGIEFNFVSDVMRLKYMLKGFSFP